MHYKDGTPATIGDIIQHDNGDVGIVIGGQIGNDTCTTQVVKFENAGKGYGSSAFFGVLRDSEQKVVSTAGCRVSLEAFMQTREMVKIGHMDIGQG